MVSNWRESDTSSMMTLLSFWCNIFSSCLRFTPHHSHTKVLVMNCSGCLFRITPLLKGYCIYFSCVESFKIYLRTDRVINVSGLVILVPLVLYCNWLLKSVLSVKGLCFGHFCGLSFFFFFRVKGQTLQRLSQTGNLAKKRDPFLRADAALKILFSNSSVKTKEQADLWHR